MATNKKRSSHHSTELLEPIEILVRGRRSKVKPFGRAQEKDALRRIARRTPEVMVKVTGGGKTSQHVLAHLTYITRKGKLEALNDEHDKYASRDDMTDLMAEWGLDIARGAGKNKLVFNLILSMPAGTDPEKLHKAVQNFARDEFFGERPYLMVLHEPETDPSSKRAEHPHVHMVLKAEGYDGTRLYIRKAMLEKWRLQFAERLREQGIEANATPREIRGKTRKPKKDALLRLDWEKRPSYVRDSKFDQARQDAEKGAPVQPWDVAIQKRREAVTSAYKTVASDLRKEGDQQLAAELEQFAASLPPIETERQQLARFVRDSVKQQRAKQQAPRTSERVEQAAERAPDNSKQIDPGSKGDIER